MKKIFLIINLFVFILSGCSKDEELNVPVSENKVQISAAIENVDAKSRANIGINGKGNFVNNDALSLLYSDKLETLTLTNGSWEPAPNWDNLGATEEFSGFFPPIPDVVALFDHKVATDQRTKEAFEQSDLLFAQPVKVQRGEEVKLNFKHLMSCITVRLKGNRYTPEQLAQATVTLKAYNQIQVYTDGRLGKVFDHDDKQFKGDIPEITLAHKGDGVFQAIVCPQKVHKFEYGTHWLKITIQGKDYFVNKPPTTLNGGVRLDEYKSGGNINLTYTFESRPKGKTLWVHGLTNMPDVNTWNLYDFSTTYKIPHLLWSPIYGWYDCNKKDTNSSYYSDMNLCWAATASNMLHWWLDQNKEYVDKYKAIYEAEHPGKTIPMNYTGGHNSAIFDDFKRCFEDKGSFAQSAIRWYIEGVYNDQDGAAKLESKNSGGYFKNIFDLKSLVTVTGVTTVEDLSRELSTALQKKKAIGFTIFLDGFGQSRHAMTIWGAKFDEKGLVTHIYYVDNNDENLNATPVGLFQSKIGTNDKNQVCIENSQGETKIPLEELQFLDLGTTQWKAYFQNK